MKFNCGPTKAERRLAAKQAYEAQAEWHRKFLWLPKRMGTGDCRWLEYIWQRAIFTNSYWDYGTCYFRWYYFYAKKIRNWEYKTNEQMMEGK